MSGNVLSISISSKKGMRKGPVRNALFIKGHGIEGKLPANHGTLVVGGPMVTAWVGVTPVAGHPEGVSGTDQSQSTSNGSNPFDVAARRKDI